MLCVVYARDQSSGENGLLVGDNMTMRYKDGRCN